MRAILLLAVFVPLALCAALYLGRRCVRAWEKRQHRLNTAQHIAEIEAENAQLDELNQRLLDRKRAPYADGPPDDHWAS